MAVKVRGFADNFSWSDGDDVAVEDGHLVIRNEAGAVIAVVAAGQWIAAEVTS